MSPTVTISRPTAKLAWEALGWLALGFGNALARLPDTDGPRQRNVLIELRDDAERHSASLKMALEAQVPSPAPELMVCDFEHGKLKVVSIGRDSLCRESLPLIEQAVALLDGLKDETWAARGEALVSVRRRLEELRLLHALEGGTKS